MKRLTISGGEITFYEPIYAKCSNKNAPKIQKQIDKNIPFYDMLGYKSEYMTIEKIEDIYKKLAKLEDVLEKYDIESAEDLDKFIHHKDCQIEKWKQDYENCSKLEKLMSKEYQYCLDNWRACERELAELKQNAIMPKFKVGQEVWVNDWTGQLRIGRIYEVQTNAVLHSQQPLITYLVDFYGNYEDDDQENDYYEEKDIFATKEEAEKKLAEIKGKKDE